MTTIAAEIQARIDGLSLLASSSAAEMAASSILEQLDRIIEMAVMSSLEAREIARFPDVYLSDAESMLAARLRSAGLLDLFGSSRLKELAVRVSEASDSIRNRGITPSLESSLFSRFTERDLRCQMCGYHFRATDLSPERQSLASAHCALLASRHDPRREVDPFKNPRECSLEIDHKWPFVAWGPTRLSNLQLLCRFCNQGKQAAVYGGELVPNVVGGGLSSGLDARRPHAWVVRQSLVVRILLAGAHCEACRSSSQEVELTVRPQSDSWLPWEVIAVCYDCAVKS